MNQVVADSYDLNSSSDVLGKVESISNVAMEVVSNVEEENDSDLVTSREEQDEEVVDALGEQDCLTNTKIHY